MEKPQPLETNDAALFTAHPSSPAPPATARISTAAEAMHWPDRALISLLILASVVPYANTLFNAFVYDDNTQVMNNPYIQSFHHLRAIFSTTVWSYVGAQGVTNYYRPMMTLGYLLCYKFFGGEVAYGFHLANVLLHAAVVCVLFKVTELMVKDRTWAFAAAALFALHPIHTESVAWIAAVTDLEVTLFYLLAFWLFLKVAQPGGGRSELALAGMVVAFLLALLSKEQALTFPALAVVYEHFYREDRAETRWSQKFSRYGVLWLLVVAYLLFRVRAFGALAPVKQISNLTRREALLSALALIGQYCGKLLWPVHLCAFYVFRRSTTPLDPRVLAGAGALILVAILFVALARWERLVSFGIIWFFATLAPVLNAQWMAANVFAERYLYLPSVGFCWVLGFGCARLWAAISKRPARWRWVCAAGFGMVAALCAARIVLRNRDWRNDVVLYTRTLAVYPDAYPIRNNLGTVYWMQGNVAGAEREWQRALEANPGNAIVLNNLGLVMSKEKRFPEAVEFFRRAMRRKPNYTDPHLNLGSVLRQLGEETGPNSGAELQLRAAVALSPLNAHARNELGQLYLNSGRLLDAAEQFQRSVESEPNPVAYDALGDIEMRRGETGKAKGSFSRALVLGPFDSHAHFALGAIDAAAGRAAQALDEYNQGLQTDPANSEALAAVRKLKNPGANSAGPSGDRK
ncbi:MAG TPA: tetratricopeptide repeat protein [Terriglobia bacterium]|nr:tetratricopeptide repeat protein [Terriglobia bacterium]